MDEEEISLRELILVLVRRRWIIAAVTGLSLLAAVVLSWWVLPTVYEAKVTIGVPMPTERESPEGGGAAQTTATMAVGPLKLTTEGYRLQVKHPAVLQAALDEVGAGRTLGQLAAAINTKVIKDTTLIEIAVQDEDPTLAAQLANAVAREFVRFVNELGASQSGGRLAALEGSIRRADEDWSSAMEEWRQLEASGAGADQLETELQARIRDVVAFKTEADRLRAEIAAYESRLKAAEDELARMSPVIVTRRALTDDDAFRELLASLTGDRAAALRGLNVTQEEVNDAYIQALDRVASLRADLAGARSRLQGLEAALTRAQREVEALRAQLAQRRVQEERLQARIQAARDSYLALVREREQVSIERGGGLPDAEMQVVVPAEVPDTPVKPRRLLNVAVAGVLGLMVGVFAAFFADYWERSAPTGAGRAPAPPTV